jgi:hypothetical protein
MSCWQADGCGRLYGGVDGRAAGAGCARLWAGTGRGRCGDRRLTAPVGGVAPSGAPTTPCAGGSDVAGYAGPAGDRDRGDLGAFNDEASHGAQVPAPNRFDTLMHGYRASHHRERRQRRRRVTAFPVRWTRSRIRCQPINQVAGGGDPQRRLCIRQAAADGCRPRARTAAANCLGGGRGSVSPDRHRQLSSDRYGCRGGRCIQSLEVR